MFRIQPLRWRWFRRVLSVAAALLLLPVVALAADGNWVRAEPEYIIRNDNEALLPRPVCIGRKEAARYALALQKYLLKQPAAKLDDAINATSHMTAGHGGGEYNCFVIRAKPVFFDNPSDIVDVIEIYDVPRQADGDSVLFARADVINDSGEILTRSSVGGDLYAMPRGPDVIRRVRP